MQRATVAASLKDGNVQRTVIGLSRAELQFYSQEIMSSTEVTAGSCGSNPLSTTSNQKAVVFALFSFHIFFLIGLNFTRVRAYWDPVTALAKGGNCYRSINSQCVLTVKWRWIIVKLPRQTSGNEDIYIYNWCPVLFHFNFRVLMFTAYINLIVLNFFLL